MHPWDYGAREGHAYSYYPYLVSPASSKEQPPFIDNFRCTLYETEQIREKLVCLFPARKNPLFFRGKPDPSRKIFEGQ